MLDDGPMRPSPPDAALTRMQEALVQRIGARPLAPRTTMDCATPGSDVWKIENRWGRAHPERLGRFEIERPLGAGAMGTVYAARDPLLQRRVAVKLLHAELVSADALARVYREAQGLARLSHPHVVQVFAIGHHVSPGGVADVFVAMEYIEGLTLDRWCADATPSPSEIVDVYLQAGRGLAAIHGAGLIHRDFKPTNVMRDAAGRVRVLDLGLVRAQVAVRPAELEPRTISRPIALDSSQTDSQALLGTPAYMAPEQFLGEPATRASDQFAYCVSLWEALHGERPYRARTPYELIEAVTEGRLEASPAAAHVPPRVIDGLRRGLSCNPGDRHPSMAALLATLQPPRRRRVIFFASGLGVAVLAAAVAPAVVSPAAACPVANEAEQVWDERTRSAVHSALAQLDGDVARRIMARLDDHTDAVHDAATRTCEGGDAAGASAREACLSRRVAGLRAIVEVLAQADAATAAKAGRIVDGLHDPTCATDTALAGPALPADPQARADVNEASRLGGRAVALGLIPQLQEATEAAQAAVTVARRSGYAPAIGEALGNRAHVSIRRGEHGAALDDFTEAYEIYVEAHDDGGAAMAALSALWVTLQSHAYDDAARWAREADSRAQASPVPNANLQARLRHRQGQLAFALGDLDEAIVLLDEARRRFEALDEPREVATVIGDSGPVHGARGDHDASARAASRAISILRETFGDGDPQIATHYLNLGNAEQSRKRHPEAYAAFRECLRRREAALPPEHPLIAIAAYATATALADLERDEEARALLSRVRSILPAEHYVHAATHLVEGGLAARRDRLPQAEQSYERGILALEAAMGAENPAVKQARSERDAQLGKARARLAAKAQTEADLQAGATTSGAAPLHSRTSSIEKPSSSDSP